MSIDTHETRRLLAHDPTDMVALQRLALDCRAGGDGLRALRLFLRAYRLHGDAPALASQVNQTLHVALNQISTLLDPGRFNEAGAALEWLAGFVPVRGHLARLLGTVRLIQGRDAEAARLADLMDLGETGLGTALAALSGHRQTYDFIGTVVIPAFRMADTIERALDSIVDAMAHYRQASGRDDAKVHIVVVDDCSPDDTPGVVMRWARARPDQSVALIANNQNRGAGRSRNAGVAAAFGPYLWFLDADDYFFPPHLFVTAQVLDQRSDLDFVRTGMVFDTIDQDISPVWRSASEVTYPCNLCVRRPCHDQIGGFPEEAPFTPANSDDVAYARALAQVFAGVLIPDRTVHYTMRPGNVLDRLRDDMISGKAPGEGAVVDARYMAVELLIRRRLYALGAVPPPPPPAEGGPGEGVPSLAAAQVLMAEGRTDAAVLILKAAVAVTPAAGDVWYTLGLAAYKLSARTLALGAFRRAAMLRPDLGGAQTNLGMMLLEDGAVAEAVGHLRQAAAVLPDDLTVLFLLGQGLRRLGALAEAAGLLSKALTLAPLQANIRAEHARVLLDGGDAAAALAAARLAAVVFPALYEAHAVQAAALERLGQRLAALAAWTRAIHCNQGYGEAFTRRAMLLLTAQWGPPPPPRRPATTTTGRLAATSLGRNGRFGNQLLQYGVTRLYAERHGLELEVPEWLGRHFYDLDDPLPGPALPRLSEAEADLPGRLGGGAAVAAGHDVDGYFCGDTTPLRPFADRFRQIFTPGRHLRDHAQAIQDRLRDAGDVVVAIHLRRGDFGWGQFWVAPEAWYLDWLADLWPTLRRPVLYVASDDPTCAAAFAAYRPLSAGDVAEALPGAEFFVDFHALCVADTLAVSNSTFSFTAAMLNQTAKSFYRPDRGSQGLKEFSPWSSSVLV
ncbi:glycosyltransferase [Novispirillum sp. DQ9]|uniref:glycosyltransferase n=1 Tax=Novispirillum sp. DQ9 TaxID=3398612 RepID=UPI003C79CEAB